MTRLFALLLSVLALGLVAGCGGDDDEDSGGGAAETTEQPADKPADKPAEQPAAGGTVEVGMKGIKFDPDSVTVKAGGTVNWTNNESIPHDVTKEEGPGAKFSSGNGNMKEGDTYKQTFKEAGEVKYVCTIHPNMKGNITVE